MIDKDSLPAGPQTEEAVVYLQSGYPEDTNGNNNGSGNDNCHYKIKITRYPVWL